jgi:hypothetical protein
MSFPKPHGPNLTPIKKKKKKYLYGFTPSKKKKNKNYFFYYFSKKKKKIKEHSSKLEFFFTLICIGTKIRRKKQKAYVYENAMGMRYCSLMLLE